MNMDLDKDDLAALCAGLTTDEVDRVHRLLHEWNVGPDSSFPVQLSLLTKAQWRIAANLPRLMNDSRKLIELHLAEYRRQTKTMVDGFADTVDDKIESLKTMVETHDQATQESANSIHGQFVAVETVAREIQEQLLLGAAEWNRAKNKFVDERWHFERVCKNLDERLNWWNVCWFIVGALVFLGIGMLIDHYDWKQ
jgi:hypothetical protein